MTDLRVRLFARFREEIGVDFLSIAVTAGITVSDLRQQLIARYPKMKPLILRSAIAVNEEYSEDTRQIFAHDDVAVIPPVSGG